MLAGFRRMPVRRKFPKPSSLVRAVGKGPGAERPAFFLCGELRAATCVRWAGFRADVEFEESSVSVEALGGARSGGRWRRTGRTCEWADGSCGGSRRLAGLWRRRGTSGRGRHCSDWSTIRSVPRMLRGAGCGFAFDDRRGQLTRFKRLNTPRCRVPAPFSGKNANEMGAFTSIQKDDLLMK